MRITILQGAFFPVPPVRGGAVEKLWHQLGIAFAAQGHTVTQVSRAVAELPSTNVENGVTHVRVAGYDQPVGGLKLKWRDLLYTRRALHAAPTADILVTNTFWAPLLAPRRAGLIYVSVERMPKGQMRLYQRATRLRACSQAVADGICAQAPGLADRVIVVPNPLPFVPQVPAATRRGPVEILYVGRIHPVKGVEMLLRAFVHAKEQAILPPETTLRFVGPADTARGGGGDSWWKEHLRGADRSDVRWDGPIYDPEILNAAYQRAAVMAYPTLDEAGEAMPIAPLEAMAWGCVPVVSDLACFRDYIVPNQNGLVFDHRAPDAETCLAESLGQACRAVGGPLAEATLAVRTTHATATIGKRFLADFASALGLPEA